MKLGPDLTVKRTKVSDEVFARLLELIRDGWLKPGDRLPPERDLAQEFGVSRASFREAVRRLELLGYVGVKPGDGTIIRLPDGATLAQPFQNLLSSHAYLAKDLLEFRRLLEPQMVRLAAERCSAAQAHLLHTSLEAQRKVLNDKTKFVVEDVNFHQLIARISGNLTVLNIAEMLQVLLRELREKALAADRPRLTLEQHGAIAEAIVAGDPPKAQQAMLEHLASVEQSIVRKGAARMA